MATLEDLRKQVVEFRNDRDWKQFHNFKDMLLSLNLEVSEFSEHFQWKTDTEVSEASKEELGEELADILYWILLFSEDLGIDLEQAFSAKMQKNTAKYPVEKARGNKSKYSALG